LLLWLVTILISGPALVCLAFVVVNLRALRPVAPGALRSGPRATVSALVPARDEEAALGACLDALRAEPFDEILVFDDDSSDATAALAQAHAARDPRVRLLRSPGPLPAGWAGKPRACAALAEAARGDLLVFIDAGVRLEPGGLAGLLAARAATGADVVCALPRQDLGTFAERLVVPLLHLIYFALAPLWLIPSVRSPLLTAANGQLMLATAAGVRRFGGHAHPAVRGAVVDDQVFCRTAKEHGLRLVFADGQRLSRCRMYTSAAEVRQGFVKNLYLGIGGTPLRLAAVLALVLWSLLAPLLVLAAGAAGHWSAGLAPLRPLFWAALSGALALPLLRALLARRFGQPLLHTVLLHPLAIGALAFIAIESAVRAHRGGLSWRGRAYGLAAGVLPEAQR
jgi:chlorobactene glucosyltransferase